MTSFAILENHISATISKFVRHTHIYIQGMQPRPRASLDRKKNHAGSEDVNVCVMVMVMVLLVAVCCCGVRAASCGERRTLLW